MFCPARDLPRCAEEEKKEQVQFSEGASVAVFLTLEVELRGGFVQSGCFENGSREWCHGLLTVLVVCVASQRCKGREGESRAEASCLEEKPDQKAFSQNTSKL